MLATQHRGWRSILVMVFIAVIGTEGNIPPRFNIQTTLVKPEDTAINTTIGQLLATDPDGPQELIFSIPHGTGSLVRLGTPSGNSDTGRSADIILNKELDRDHEPPTRQLFFEVTDGTYTVSAQITLIITDVNDEAPSFVNLPYRVTVNETHAVNSSVFKVEANDTDSGAGGQVFYSMVPNAQDVDDSYRQTFSLNTRIGEITLERELDYESRTFFQFKIHAWDTNINETLGGNKAKPVDFFVTVQDVQDSPPVFFNLPYIKTIYENATKNTFIIKVSAYDGDQGVPNPISYMFVGGPHENFTIDKNSGVITLKEPVDFDLEEVRNRGGRFVIFVNATEDTTLNEVQLGETNTTTSVSITIEDVNDNSPKFDKETYNAEVQENTPVRVPLTLTGGDVISVRDQDQGENSQFYLRIEKNGETYVDFVTNPSQNQTIYSQANVMIAVNNQSLLDYEERHNITFQITAQEKTVPGHNSTATIFLSILDANDNSPIFNKTQETVFNISEGAKVGTMVGMITATDKDSNDFGNVYYELEDDENSQMFGISEENGNITVSEELDREIKHNYILFVVASDNKKGDPSARRSTRQRVEVRLTDVNDNAPEFIGNNPPEVIAENVAICTRVAQVSARDKDLGQNGEVEYSITDGNITGLFRIETSNEIGVVYTNNSLIGLSGTLFIIVNATDKGTPSMTSSRKLIFDVQDVNLNSPVFVNPNASAYNQTIGEVPEVTVEEEEDIGSRIYDLLAEDSDKGHNGEVYYRLLPTDDWQKFQVNGNGSLTNAQKLDRETQETYEIQVSAEDGGRPVLKTSLTIKVNLEDIDDNPPEFDSSKDPYMLKVKEEDPTALVGFVNITKDKDKEPENKIACYYIFGGERIDHFTLNKTTGELRLKKKLDRETVQKVNLVIKADKNCSLNVKPIASTGEPPDVYQNFVHNNSLLWLQVKVLDINDNPPVFKPGELTTAILFDTDIGTSIYNLKDDASDKDSDANAVTYFRALSLKPSSDISGEIGSKDAFILRKNGSIVTNILFSSGMLGHFIMKVEARDIGNLNATTDFKIYIISNIQRVKIVFDKEPDEVFRLKDKFISELEAVLNYKIVVDKIASHKRSDTTLVESRTDMFIHARYKDTGEVVPATELWRAFDFTLGIDRIFTTYGVSETKPVVACKQLSNNESVTRDLTVAFITVAIALTVVTVSLAIGLFFIIQKYQRRLRAATIKVYGTQEQEKDDKAPPGTNLYLAAASNPVYMKNFAIVDEDTTSVNSLDENAVGEQGFQGNLDPFDEQEMTLQIIDDSPSKTPIMNGNRNLDLVLDQYQEEMDLKKTNESSLIGDQDSKDNDSGMFMPVDVNGLEATDI